MGTLLQGALMRLQKAAKMADVSPDHVLFFSEPLRTVTVNFPVKMEGKGLEMFEGYRVHHSMTLGPAKGGLIIAPNYTIDDMKALAMLMTLKCALNGVPLGGSCGVILADPKQLTPNELERLVRRYIDSVINVIGPEQDILGPDINTDSKIMAWIADTYAMSTGAGGSRVCTGKPVEIGGIVGRKRAVSLGITYLLHELSRTEFEEIKGQRVVIQGFGHVGKNFAESAAELGADIIGISDSACGLYRYEGLNVEDVIAYKNAKGTLKGYPDATEISNADLVRLECDWLIPCGAHSLITEELAPEIRCRRIIEGANAAITYEAERILWLRDIPVIPDILANAGGLIVSYLEWVQNFADHTWDLDQVKNELKRIMTTTFHLVYNIRTKKDISFREAAYIVALNRLVKAHGQRGIFP